MRRGSLFLAIVPLLFAGPLAAQQGHTHPPTEPRFAWGEAEPLVAEHVNHFSRVDLPALPPDAARRIAPAQFVFTIQDELPEATPAIMAAAELWSTHVSSSVPINVTVTWLELDENILGAAAPRLIANFTAALDPNTWFPTALASALEGQDINPGNPDIELQFNANFAHWYFGTDGNPPPNRFDFMTVVIHEIGHGLGFVGSMRVDGAGWGRWGFQPAGQAGVRWPAVYDRFAETDHEGITSPLLDTNRFPNPSTDLAAALQSRQVYFNSPTSVAANIESQLAQGLEVPEGGRPKLYAPDPWVPGSSYSHLTEERVGGVQLYYPPGSLNSLMTPRLGATEVIRTPGPVTCGMFRDMGWPLGVHCEAMLPADEIIFDEPMIVAGPCPNPAVGGQTRLRVHVAEQQRVRVTLYDVLGRRVQPVFDGRVLPTNPVLSGERVLCPPVGAGYIDVDARGIASGMYFLNVQTEAAEQTVRLVVVN